MTTITSRSQRLPLGRALTCATLAVMLTACGGGGGGDDGGSPPPSGDQLPTIAAASPLDDNRQIGVVRWPNGATSTGGQGLPVEGVPCAPSVETYHIHSHLSIIVDGQAQSIPADIGIVETDVLDCNYYVHTHDLSGKIHVEAPAAADFTLGQLFAVWGQPLESDNVAGITGKPMEIFVTENNTVTRYTGDPKALKFASKRHIAIQLGTKISQVPYFTWTAN